MITKNILGIETSCDETAAAIVENGVKVRSNVIETSVDFHAQTGGIVPEIAARDAEKKILPAIKSALKNAKMDFSQIDAIAVTTGPGLVGSLLVGVAAARTLAFLKKKPLVPIHHITGHICANRLNEKQKPDFPALVLTVSGGHTELFLWKNDFDFEFLGATIDDAAGEALDKAARMLGLGFPGGPAIEKLSQNIDDQKYDFPRPMRRADGFDFSFSGLKTALFYEIKKTKNLEKERKFLAASFETAVVDALFWRLKKAAEHFQIREIHLSGGVSANQKWRQKIQKFCAEKNLNFRAPEKIFCTDNAAMIAAAGFFKIQKFPAKKWNWKTVDLALSRTFF